MSASPLVSVILPTYNSAKYLKETLESVIHQTYKNLEIIIIDDCSTDNTIQIINSFTDPRIKFYKNDTNLGIAENTNKALSFVKGEFIMMQDHDDISSPYRAEAILKVLIKHEDITGCGTRNHPMKKTTDPYQDTSEPIIAMDDEMIATTDIFDRLIFHPTIMYRSSILKLIDKPYSGEFKIVSDDDFYYRLNKVGAKWYLLGNKYLKYRQHANNVSLSNYPLHYSERQCMIKRVLQDILPFATDIDIRNHSIVQSRREVLSYRGEANNWCHDWYMRMINYNLEHKIYNHDKLLKTMASYWKLFVTLSNILTPIKAIKLYNSIEELKPYLSSNSKLLKEWQKRFIRAMKWKFIRNKVLPKK